MHSKTSLMTWAYKCKYPEYELELGEQIHDASSENGWRRKSDVTACPRALPNAKIFLHIAMKSSLTCDISTFDALHQMVSNWEHIYPTRATRNLASMARGLLRPASSHLPLSRNISAANHKTPEAGAHYDPSLLT